MSGPQPVMMCPCVCRREFALVVLWALLSLFVGTRASACNGAECTVTGAEMPIVTLKTCQRLADGGSLPYGPFDGFDVHGPKHDVTIDYSTGLTLFTYTYGGW